MQSTTPAILWLGEPDCHRRELVGGKAAHLSRLADTFRVPPGFCLTADALGRRHIADDDVAAAYHALAVQCQAPDVSVAVRSSGIAEDGDSASFAGQYDTYLNVVGIDAVIQAIGRCQASANSARIRAYRQQRGVDEPAPLAVLVQQLVAADVAAIVFSANPVTGISDQVVINASWGLGESIVGGTVTPDSHIVSKASLALISSTIADKQRMTVRSAEGTRETDVPRFLRTQPALAREQILEIAQLAVALEQEMGWPVDVECAYRADQLYLLQCRAVTALHSD